jgi:hypothetical protein
MSIEERYDGRRFAEPIWSKNFNPASRKAEVEIYRRSEPTRYRPVNLAVTKFDN